MAPPPRRKIQGLDDVDPRFSLWGRANLARVYLLIDARHGLKPVTINVLETLDKAGQLSGRVDQDRPGEMRTSRLLSPRPRQRSRGTAAYPQLLDSSGAPMPASELGGRSRVLSERRVNGPAAPIASVRPVRYVRGPDFRDPPTRLRAGSLPGMTVQSHAIRRFAILWCGVFFSPIWARLPAHRC